MTRNDYVDLVVNYNPKKHILETRATGEQEQEWRKSKLRDPANIDNALWKNREYRLTELSQEDYIAELERQNDELKRELEAGPCQ